MTVFPVTVRPRTLVTRVSMAMLALAATAFGLPAPAALLFSEYVEGSGNNKSLEIYNTGPGSASLAGCQVKMYFNGNLAAGQTFTLPGVNIAAGDVHVLVNPSASPTLLALQDSVTSNSTWFNGDDAVELVCGGVTRDVIGQIGFDPGTEWGTGLVSTADNTLRRQSAVCVGDTNGADAFVPAAQWDGFVQDTFGGLGSHSATCLGIPQVTLSVSTATGSEAARTVITVTATASAPVSGNQTVTLGVSGTGITAGDYILSSTVITIPDSTTSGSVTFTVQDDAAIEGNEMATLSLSNPSAGIVLGAPASQTITIIDNETACGLPATKISAVQGTGATAALNGQTVTVEGIVVGRYAGATSQTSLQGFFVQEEDVDADADPATSEGIFILDPAQQSTAVVGDRVRVTGAVSENFLLTQITVSATETCATNQQIPTAATIALPVPGIPNGSLATANAAINAYYEPFEGMLVEYPAALTIAEYFQLERYGQLVLSQGGRIPTFTAAAEPGTTAYVNHQIEVARRKVVLDDGNNWQNAALENGTALPYPQPGLSVTNRFRGGDTITGLKGVLHWSWAGFGGTDAWRVRPVPELATYTFTSANPRPTAPPAAPGSLKVVSFNVLNYFTTVDTTSSTSSGPCGPSGTLDCRGPDSAAELTRQTDKLVTALCGLNADIVGLAEIENNASASLAALTAATNAVVGCGPYNFVNTGFIGTDAIKVGFIYKSSTVSLQGAHAILDAGEDPRFRDTKNRPMLAQTFVETASGEALTVAVNHLKSKGSDCLDIGDPDLGDGQGNCNLTRELAAQAIVDWLATDPTGSGDPDFLIIGDLNSYAKEDPIDALIAGPDDTLGTPDDYTDLHALFGGPAAYGYVFDGQIGYLDYALANATLLAQVTGTEAWHINADEPPSFDYNDTIRDTGEASFEAKPSALPLYAVDPFRTSDHDPILVHLDLGPPDTDGDGLPDAVETGLCPSAFDADSDDDGIPDGVEDSNHDGGVDPGETDPCNADSDGDGVQDGTELGNTTGVPDPDGAGPLLGTDPEIFVPDADPLTQTDPLDSDSDNDGFSDGAEDLNGNGAVDPGESNPLDAGSVPNSAVTVPALGPLGLLLLGALLTTPMRFATRHGRQSQGHRQR